MKNNNKSDNLERKKSVFFLIGLTISLSFTLFAFEWKSIDKHEFLDTKISIEAPEEIVIPITKDKEPEPQKQEERQVVENLEVVDNQTKTEEVVIETEFEETLKVEEIDLSNEVVEVIEQKIFRIVEQMPEYPGGDKALLMDIQSALRYPKIALDEDISGTVYVEFVVEKNGTVSSAIVLKGVHPLLDNEAIRVVKQLKKFKPGKQRNQPVPVYFNVPITFVIG